MYTYMYIYIYIFDKRAQFSAKEPYFIASEGSVNTFPQKNPMLH